MPVPVDRGKHRHESLFTGSDLVKYAARRRGRRITPLPERVVLLFGTRLRRHILRRYRAAGVPNGPDPDFLRIGSKVGVAFLSIGAPSAAIAMEELRAHGVRQFVVLGAAGSLRPDLRAGDVVLCTRAIRDEGTSHHYLPPSLYSHPSVGLTQRLKAILATDAIPFREGPSWTTDAPYRETVPEIIRFRRQGVLTVEMEASAVFSVAARLRLKAAALFVVSDHLDERGWEPKFDDIGPALKVAFAEIVRALTPRGGTGAT